MEVLDQGLGALFADPDPDRARAHFRQKNRKMVSKVMDLADAVKQFVREGDYLGTGGFGGVRAPIAACHEIVRQRIQHLGFAGLTATHDFQVLAAGQAFDKLDIAYVVGLEIRGLSQAARRYLESGKVKITEWTNFSLFARLKAAAMGSPFVAARNLGGTDTFKQSGAKMVECPFTGKKIVLLPALYPDVAILHVHEADIYGNCRFKGTAVADIELANAAKHLIITTERLVHHDEIAHDPSATRIPFYLVDAVCEVPFGAYPGDMPYEYYSHEDHLQEWLDVEKDPEAFEMFLENYIYSCSDHGEYIDKNGGLKMLSKLRHTGLRVFKED